MGSRNKDEIGVGLRRRKTDAGHGCCLRRWIRVPAVQSKIGIERGANLILSDDLVKLVTSGKGWRLRRMTERGHRAPVGVGAVGHARRRAPAESRPATLAMASHGKCSFLGVRRVPSLSAFRRIGLVRCANRSVEFRSRHSYWPMAERRHILVRSCAPFGVDDNRGEKTENRRRRCA